MNKKPLEKRKIFFGALCIMDLEINLHAKPGVYSSGNKYKNSQVENIPLWGKYNSKNCNEYLVGNLARDKIL